MNQIEELAFRLDQVITQYDLEPEDVLILGVVTALWRQGNKVRITDLLKFKNIGSPANLHARITKTLVKAKLLKLEPSEEDARVKFVVRGIKYDDLDKRLGDL